MDPSGVWIQTLSSDLPVPHCPPAFLLLTFRKGVRKRRSSLQRSQQYYGHIVLSIEHDYHAKEPKYWIGNIQQKANGWCFREHIYGILVEVQVEWEGRLFTRPFPKSVYEEVRKLVEDNRWNREAWSLCEPSWDQ